GHRRVSRSRARRTARRAQRRAAARRDRRAAGAGNRDGGIRDAGTRGAGKRGSGTHRVARRRIAAGRRHRLPGRSPDRRDAAVDARAGARHLSHSTRAERLCAVGHGRAGAARRPDAHRRLARAGRHTGMNAVLALEDGTWFQGVSAGAPGETSGEVVFNTSMTGYQEILTDPSYAGQIVTMTSSQIGNYGVNRADNESRKPQVAGFVVREASPVASSWRADQTLREYLVSHGIVAIAE